MKKTLRSLILLLLMIFSLTFNVWATADLNINSKSAVLIDGGTGDIIYESNKDEKLPPASIAKIMTMILGLEAVENGRISLNDEVVISSYASSMGGSQVYLEAGETQVVEELFRAIAIRSANDAAVALAECISGTEDIFVKMMNGRAKELGMNNTNFTNASGLPDEEHYTSAYDVALMSRELLKHDIASEWLKTYIYDMKVGKNKDKIQTLVNTNKLIKQYQGVTGVKTGSTNQAGFCLSGSAKRGNLELIAVIMGADNSKTRFNEVQKMLDFGFANYDSVVIGKKGEIIQKIEIEKGSKNFVNAVFERDSFVLLSKGQKDSIDKQIILDKAMIAPIYRGETIGKMIISIDGKKTHEINLVAEEDIEKSGFFNMMKKTVTLFLNQK